MACFFTNLIKKRYVFCVSMDYNVIIAKLHYVSCWLLWGLIADIFAETQFMSDIFYQTNTKIEEFSMFSYKIVS